MPPVVLAAVTAVTVALAALAWMLLSGPDQVQQLARQNLTRGLQPAADAGGTEVLAEEDEQRPGALSALARRLTPGAFVTRLDRLLARAGRPAAWPLERLLVAKIVLVIAAGALSLLYLGANAQPLAVVVAAVVTVVAYFVPELLLHSRGEERRKAIALELADTLDQMTIAVEAGLGFDSAMARAGQNGKGPLAEELVRTLQDIQVGQPRRQAYLALAHRAGVPDLGRFIRAIVQADAYGIAIADVLRTQAAEMRLKRRQRAEEKAMQIPVKVIFPLMLCILPVLFIVLMGPAVMDIVDAFSGM